jgi:hypothetical protein
MGNVELAAFVKRQYIIFKAVTPARFVAATILMRGSQHVGQRFAEWLRCFLPGNVCSS